MPRILITDEAMQTIRRNVLPGATFKSDAHIVDGKWSINIDSQVHTRLMQIMQSTGAATMSEAIILMDSMNRGQAGRA